MRAAVRGMEGAGFCFPPAGTLQRFWSYNAKQHPSFELSWLIATSVSTEFHALPIEKAEISSP